MVVWCENDAAKRDLANGKGFHHKYYFFVHLFSFL